MLDLVHDALAHERDERRRRRRVRASRERQEVAAHARAAQVVPQPPGRPEGDLLHGVVDARREGDRGGEGERRRDRHPEVPRDDARDPRRGGRLVRARDEVGALRALVGEVDRRDDRLDLVEALELGALRDEGAVDPHHRAAVVVQPPAVAPLLVRVEVDTARLGGRAAAEVDAVVELAQLVVRARAVGDDLDAVEGEGCWGRLA